MLLFAVTSYYSQKNKTLNKIGSETYVKSAHIGRHVDLSNLGNLYFKHGKNISTTIENKEDMTAHDFIRGLVEHMEKIIIKSRLFPGWMIGAPSASKVFYPDFTVEDKEITLDTSKIALADIGNSSLTYPAIWIDKMLAFEMRWFEVDPNEQDPQFAVKLGPNLCIKLTVMKFLQPLTLNLILLGLVKHRTSLIQTGTGSFPDGQMDI